MSKMIFKGWEKMGLLKSFNIEFQFQAMEVNITTPLFLITFNSNLKHQKEEDDHDLDREDYTLEIMQNYLNV